MPIAVAGHERNPPIEDMLLLNSTFWLPESRADTGRPLTAHPPGVLIRRQGR
jgi:hypothetical protein